MRGGRPGSLGGRPRGLRPLGAAGRDHRPGHRRWRHRRRGRRSRRRRDARRPGRPSSPGSRPAPDQRRDRPRAPRRPADAPSGGAGPGRTAGAGRSTAGARDGSRRGPPRPARLGQPVLATSASSTSTTPPSGRTPSPDPGAARPCCGSRARRRPSSPPRMATSGRGRSIRGSAPRCRWPRRRGTSRSPARGRSA